jgi:hypothetical protein
MQRSEWRRSRERAPLGIIDGVALDAMLARKTEPAPRVGLRES